MGSQVVTLYEDKAKTNALYPRTKISAISDNNNRALSQIIVANGGSINTVRALTQSEYDAIATKDPSTLYFIKS